MPWESPLHTAARHGNLETVRSLLTEENVNSKSDWGYTPLNCASYGGHTEIIKVLLDFGAKVRIHNGEGWTPLHAACQQGKADAVSVLLDNGAKCCVNFASKSYHTPLFVACRSKNDCCKIIRLLVGAGADVNTRNKSNRTPLMEASAKGMTHKVEILLNAGADVTGTDDAGLTALHMATPYPKIVRLLVDAGADVNLKDPHHEIPLQRRGINKESISILLESGAGADVPCTKHKRCKNISVVQCMYKTAFNTAKKGGQCEPWSSFDKYFVASEIAGLNTGHGNSLIDPSDLIGVWLLMPRDEYRVNCQTEYAMIKTGKIPGGHSTYLDVLLQRPYALRHVDPTLLQPCRHKFPIYGEMIWRRFHVGRRRLSLIDDCLDFFSLTQLPRLPSECVVEILSYLPELDLKQLLTVYTTSASSMEPENKKRPNPDASLQVMKFLRVG